MDHHLASEEGAGNSRNGYGRKTITTDTGRPAVDVPRDRQASFGPQPIVKYQRRFSGLDEKIVSMYARDMSTREITGHLQDLYGIDVSPDLISTVAETFVRILEGDYVRMNPRPDAQTVIAQLPAWINHYNEVHPHRALGNRSPREFIATNREAVSAIKGGNNSYRGIAELPDIDEAYHRLQLPRPGVRFANIPQHTKVHCDCLLSSVIAIPVITTFRTAQVGPSFSMTFVPPRVEAIFDRSQSGCRTVGRPRII